MGLLYLDHTAICVLVSKPCKAKDRVVHALELALRRGEWKTVTSSHSVQAALERLTVLAGDGLSRNTEEQILLELGVLCTWLEPTPAVLEQARKFQLDLSLPAITSLEAALVFQNTEASLLSACPKMYEAIPALNLYTS